MPLWVIYLGCQDYTEFSLFNHLVESKYYFGGMYGGKPQQAVTPYLYKLKITCADL